MAKSEAKQSTALTKPETTAMARPAFLDDEPIYGFEAMDSKHTAIARLALAQSNTKQAKRSNPLYIDGLHEGLFFNSLSKEIYGPTVEFIPMFFFVNRIMFKDIETEGGGIMCMARDGVHCQLNNGGPCLHADFGAAGEKPACTEFYNYPAMLTDDNGNPDELIVLSFKSTAMKKAREWNSRMRMLKASMFAQKWRVKAIPDKKGEFDFFNVEFEFAGYVEAAEIREGLKRTFLTTREGFNAGTLTVDAERDDETEFPHGKNTDMGSGPVVGDGGM
jgi:hypothetical protein